MFAQYILAVFFAASTSQSIINQEFEDAYFDCTFEAIRYRGTEVNDAEEVARIAQSECEYIVFAYRDREMNAGVSLDIIQENIDIMTTSTNSVIIEMIEERGAAWLDLLTQIRGNYRQSVVCHAREAIEYRDIAQNDFQLFLQVASDECLGSISSLLTYSESTFLSEERISNLVILSNICGASEALSRIEYPTDPEWVETCQIFSARYLPEQDR